jgi:hypothetical protein
MPYTVSSSQMGPLRLMSSFQDMGNMHLQRDTLNFWKSEGRGPFGDGVEDLIHPIRSNKMLALYHGISSNEYTEDGWSSSETFSTEEALWHKHLDYNSKHPDTLYCATLAGIKREYFGVSFIFDSHSKLPIEDFITPGKRLQCTTVYI